MRFNTTDRNLRLLLYGLILAAMLAAPALLSGYWVRVLTSAFMYAIFTQGINIIAGYAGYPAFGNVAFFGTGAYGTAILMVNYKVPFVPAVLLAMLFSALLACLIGPAMLRLRGGYFAIGTLGIMLTLKDLVTVDPVTVGPWKHLFTNPFTGGAQGIRLPVLPWDPATTNMVFYYAMAGLMLLGILVTWWIARSKFGYGLRAIRDSSDAAEVLGVNTTLYRVLAWAISGLFASAAGGVFAYWIGFLEPPYAFDVTISIKGFLMMVIGGGGTILGPVIGAVAIEILSELIWGQFNEAHFFVLGVIVILAAMYLQNGLPSLVPLFRNQWRRLRGRIARRAAS